MYSRSEFDVVTPPRDARRQARKAPAREARVDAPEGEAPAAARHTWPPAVIGGVLACLVCAGPGETAIRQTPPVRWQDVLEQPAAWYATAEARRVADSVLAWQLGTGGWPKNIDMTQPPAAADKPDARESTIDNGATVTQIRLLARVGEATNEPRYRRGAMDGIAYLLAAQYENGGWPQYFPLRPGYYSHITYNDQAMAGVMMVLWDVADGVAPFTFMAAATGTRDKARAAVANGLDVIVETQIRVNGQLTAWCQQHDEKTLEPRPARTFERVALASSESAGLVRVLMRVVRPEPKAVEAIEAAVRWLRAVRVSAQPPRWARFYEIGTNRPIFAGRDAIVRYTLAEIEEERQKGYSWYGDYASALLDREYPGWRKRI
jgi:PelA/Pel-15E family pectate lyase